MTLFVAYYKYIKLITFFVPLTQKKKQFFKTVDCDASTGSVRYASSVRLDLIVCI